MKFSERLKVLKNQAWAEYYIDYDLLKELLAKEDRESLTPTHRSSKSNLQLLPEVSSQDFLYELNRQVEFVLLFYLREQGKVADELSSCRREFLDLSEPWPRLGDCQVLHRRYHSVALELLNLIQYVDLNVTGLRKILKKHDKQTHNNLSNLYFRGRGRVLQPLLDDASIAALIYLLEKSLDQLNDLEQSLQPPTSRQHWRHQTAPDMNLLSFQQQYYSPSLSSKVFRRKSYSAKSMVDADAVLWQIHAARRRLQETSDFVQYMAAPLMLVSDDSRDMIEEEEVVEELEEGIKEPSRFSNFLNLMSTFLYMTNYYIVAPSSGAYAQKLGSAAAMSGVIIGMTPAAALASTILYSWWTSHSYKAALMFASSCSILGNLLYAAGLPYNSLTLVMLGRLLNGFGSARSINRRYICDTFAREERTAASAAFVTAGALGMAAGPAIASLLHLTVSDGSDNPYWQAENSPGWTMFVIWSVFLFCLLFYFEDPPKKHHVPAPPSSVEMTGEKQYLLSNVSEPVGEDAKEPPIWKNIPVMVTFLVYFILKLVLECVLSSSSTLTGFYFGWSDSLSGIYLAALGLLMLPANMGVAYLARTYYDRELILAMQVFMFVGCLVILQYSDDYTLVQYLVGSVTLFLSTNALEGPNMSLLSKTIPKSWSKGIFNVGMLATEAGTLGRAVGDVFLTACGAGGLQYLLNNTFSAMSGLSFVSLAISYLCFDYLEPSEKDD